MTTTQKLREELASTELRVAEIRAELEDRESLSEGQRLAIDLHETREIHRHDGCSWEYEDIDARSQESERQDVWEMDEHKIYLVAAETMLEIVDSMTALQILEISRSVSE